MLDPVFSQFVLLLSHTGNNHNCLEQASKCLVEFKTNAAALSSMNNPTAHTYNTTAGITLTQIINQSGGHALLRTNDNDKSSS